MRHHTVPRRCCLVLFAVILVGSACGGDSDESAADEQTVDGAANAGDDVGTGADTDSPEASVVAGDMTIERLCDPVEPDVLAVLGDAVTTEHNDFYADREERILDCGWASDVSDRTLRVGFNGAPSDSMIGLSDGMQDLDGIDAPNVYAVSRTDLLAPNGWTITIQNLGADQTAEPNAIAAIANAALDTIDS